MIDLKAIWSFVCTWFYGSKSICRKTCTIS